MKLITHKYKTKMDEARWIEVYRITYFLGIPINSYYVDRVGDFPYIQNVIDSEEDHIAYKNKRIKESKEFNKMLPKF